MKAKAGTTITCNPPEERNEANVESPLSFSQSLTERAPESAASGCCLCSECCLMFQDVSGSRSYSCRQDSSSIRMSLPSGLLTRDKG